MFQIFPLFSKYFRTLRKIFTILPFPDKFIDFHPPKFLMTLFLVINHKYFRIPPLFSLFRYISPTLTNFPSVLDKFTCFSHTLRVFPSFPYFDHDAFMPHPMHVLDAPGQIKQLLDSSVNAFTLTL